MSIPTVSVLMPVYNAERYVGAAVESILGQTFANFEFLIIDDGSTDGSRAILERYAARDTRIRLTSRPNTGYLVALNEMIALARGELLARMDADDIALPDRFAAQVDYLEQHSECLALGGNVLTIDVDGDPIIHWQMPTDHETIDSKTLHGSPGMVHPTLMARREALRALGGYRVEAEWCEDQDLYLRLAEVGRLANLPKVVLKYRRHPDSISHTKTTHQAEVRSRILTDAYRRRGLAMPVTGIKMPKSITEWDHRRDWVWFALREGHLATARKHAWSAFRQQPLSIESWRVVYCALRGH